MSNEQNNYQETCPDCGSTYCVTPDHPRRRGSPVCPRCLLMDNDSKQEEIEQLKALIDNLQQP